MFLDPSFPYHTIMSVMNIPPYSIRKLVSLPLFDEINDTMSQNLHQESLEKDIAWAIAGGLLDKEKRMLLLGSWPSLPWIT